MDIDIHQKMDVAAIITTIGHVVQIESYSSVPNSRECPNKRDLGEKFAKTLFCVLYLVCVVINVS